MKIAFCTAEAAPFAKVGGLGDVAGSLPKALAELGEDVTVCLPLYGNIRSEHTNVVDTDIAFTVSHQNRTFPIRVLESTLPGSNVPVYFFENQELYGYTDEVYPQVTPEFEALRYEVFSHAILEFLKRQEWPPDVLHLQDWHTSMMAPYLKTSYAQDPFFKGAGTVLTIHNMAYQGIVDDTNWLKEGILHSDAIVAVSPTYAEEIQSDIGGAGLEDVVRAHRKKLFGIINGIDLSLFDPVTDRFIPAHYNASQFSQGKNTCKEALQMEFGLPINRDVPLFGMVTRLVEQKGLDILIEAMPTLAEQNAQFVFLGTGDPRYEEPLREANQTTSNIRSMIAFNIGLGQHIYAGSDYFLMPSRFEPCGLGQLIALRYGSIPVVRQTGGLADTVSDINENPDTGNGFVFSDYSAEALIRALKRAIDVRYRQPDNWEIIAKRGMAADHSWTQSAKAYQQVYGAVHQQHLQRT